MGGMGPEATVDFMAKVIAMSDSGRDQDHVRMVVDNDPQVPNRQVAIRTGNNDVTPHLAAMAEGLEAAGADFIVMVCNTAHVFMDRALDNVSVPFISIIDESVAEVERQVPNASVIGVMATDGCLNTDIYQDAIEAAGKTAIVPKDDDIAELMRLITAIKAGDKGDDIAEGMAAVAQKLVDRGAEAIIGGCTEIPIVFEGEDFAVPVISSTNVLAERTLALAMGHEPLPSPTI